MAEDIKRVLGQIGIGYDRFIRTSDDDHARVVQALVQRAFDKGDIYKAKYEGLYCESCEAFYTEKDLINGLCPSHKTSPKQISEENYFFKLSKYQDALLALYKNQPDFLEPESRRSEIVNFVQAGLKDFSVSRSTFNWGVPLPWDPKHVVYVWFDALINYLTAAGADGWLKDPQGPGGQDFRDRWPADVHVIGKDISRFHTIYWPAMLMSLDIPLPRKVFVHGWMTLKGERMSKSTGNMLTPDEVTAVTGPDPFRYFLLAENQFSGDGNFAVDLLMLKNNADLANDMGNLVNRSISMTRKYFPDRAITPCAKPTHSADVIASFEKLPAELAAAVAKVDPAAYIAAIVARSRLLNLYIDRTKPWALAKAGTPESLRELEEVLYALLEGVRWIGTALLSVLPFGMPELFRQLAIEKPSEQGAVPALKWGQHPHKPGEPKPLFPRLELPKAEGEK
jgi:methionyl-tRNA synthetase